MDYYKDLKQDDFPSCEDYMVERIRRGLNAGYSLTDCQKHWLGDFADALGLDGNKYRVDREVPEERDQEIQEVLNGQFLFKNVKEIDQKLAKEIEQQTNKV